MKKLLSISLIPIFALFLFGAFVALPADAQTEPTEGCTLVKAMTINDVDYAKGDDVTSANVDWGTICLLNTVNTIVDWVFIFLLAVAVALIAIAGFMWMTGGAKPESQKMAGQMIMAAVIGIVIALLARLIPALITGILM